MYRKEIRILDCTVRDGGLMNKWKFSDDFVKEEAGKAIYFKVKK